MAGIISSQEMSRGSFHLILDAEWGPSPEMTSLQSRGSIIAQKKFMFTVLWNPLGFHAVDKLRTGAKMESAYFTTNILGRVEQKVFPTGRNPHAKPLTIHLDSCSIHTSRTTEEYIRQDNMIRVQHPPYSPDLASSDFYLFPTIKEKLKDIQMADEEDLFY
jgi:hypothetical protein